MLQPDFENILQLVTKEEDEQPSREHKLGGCCMLAHIGTLDASNAIPVIVPPYQV